MIKDKLITTTLIIAGLILIFAAFAPFIFTRTISPIKFDDTGQIGDTIGGITAPFIAGLGCFLTFMAFYIQYRANKLQIENINLINKKDQINAYENKLFSMFEIHRKNVDDISIKSLDQKRIYKGQEFFQKMIINLQNIFEMTNSIDKLDLKQKTILAYLHLFYGKSLEENNNLRKYYNQFFYGKMDLSQGFISYKAWYFDKRYYDYGYGMLLSRYFRYQYQVIKYIDEYEFYGDDYNEEEIKNIKYNSAKQLRAQLTNDEQLLLYYNAITPLGKSWIDNNYIKNYKLIKNIILPQSFGYTPLNWVNEELNFSNQEINKFFEFNDKFI
ncbi:MAG: hypothetical protein JXR70_18460 [Spirochaetales bacterium]|nr:hypothetical protein [Spirochaetales bacterium]